MTGRPDKYAQQRAITRLINAAKDAGLEIGGIEIGPGEIIRLLTKGETKADAFEDWKREKANAG